MPSDVAACIARVGVSARAAATDMAAASTSANDQALRGPAPRLRGATTELQAADAQDVVAHHMCPDQAIV